MKTIIPATVMLLVHLAMVEVSDGQSDSNLVLVKAWLDVIGYIVEKSQDKQMEETFRACEEIYGMLELGRGI